MLVLQPLLCIDNEGVAVEAMDSVKVEPVLVCLEVSEWRIF